MQHAQTYRTVALLGLSVLAACSDTGTDPQPDPTAMPLANDLASLSDDFDDGSLTGWSIFNPSAASVAETGGQLQVDPAANSLWFNGSTAVLLSKLVTGDFKVTSFVSARSLANPATAPAVQFRLGGLMLRNADNSGGENYVFIVIGADGNDLSVETKSTVNSSSTFQGPAWPGAEGELRICRLGATVRTYVRAPGQAWQLQQTLGRTDLPSQIQVGPMGYANQSDPDLRLRYDSVDFARVASETDCTAD